MNELMYKARKNMKKGKFWTMFNLKFQQTPKFTVSVKCPWKLSSNFEFYFNEVFNIWLSIQNFFNSQHKCAEIGLNFMKKQQARWTFYAKNPLAFAKVRLKKSMSYRILSLVGGHFPDQTKSFYYDKCNILNHRNFVTFSFCW